MKNLQAMPGAIPVSFRGGGPFHRQVHVWSEADVEATEAVSTGDPTAAYIRSPAWRRQIRAHHPVSYTWTKVGAEAVLGMPLHVVKPQPGGRS